MERLLYAGMNIASIAILMLILFHMKQKRSKHAQRLFTLLIYINLFILITDTIMWIINGVAHPLAKGIHIFVTLVYYILNCAMSFFWVLYTDYKLHKNTVRIVKQMKFLIIPLLVNCIMVLMSIWTGWFFIIDDANIYSRGSWLIVMFFITFGYTIYALLLLFFDQKRVGWKSRQSLYFSLSTFPIIVLCSALFQWLVFGISLIWTCSSICLLAIFINVQNNQINTDYLTGLSNRNLIDDYMKIIVQNKNKNSVLFVIMIDVDDFKHINDTYGHLIGDRVLIKISEILKASCAKHGDFIARLGGDEFMITGERAWASDIEKILVSIHRLIDKYNNSYEIQQNISLSMGYAVYGDENDTLDKLMNRADENMYHEKRMNHKRRFVIHK